MPLSFILQLTTQNSIQMSSGPASSASANLAKLRQLNNSSVEEINHEQHSNLVDKKEGQSKEHVIKRDVSHQGHDHDDDEDDKCPQHGHSHSHGHGKGKGHGKPGKKNYLIIAYTTFTCLSCLYLETQVLNPFLGDFKAQLMSYLCFFNVFMCLWSYFQTMRIDSSVKKLNVNGQDPYPKLPKKHCKKCDYMKAPRVSHCSQCGKCIYRLDHHCMWTQTCIGYCNQRPFYLFTMYMTIGVLQFWYSTSRVAAALFGTCQFFSAFEPGVYILWALTCFSAGVVGAMIVFLWVGHTVMVATNFTTLDSFKKKSICPIPFIEVRRQFFRANANQFDRGEVQNLKSLFGTNILTCWLPFGRQIENQFYFDPMSPCIDISMINKQHQSYSRKLVQSKMKGKKILVNGEPIVFQNSLL